MKQRKRAQYSQIVRAKENLNNQEWDTLMTVMFYHFLAPEGGHHTWEEILLKKYQSARSFFLSQFSKFYQQKQWDVVTKNTAKILPV